ncbi:unnamed protein product [Sympodiomycopsis kandeliae]
MSARKAVMSAAKHTIAPYGTWSSPITPELLTSKSISFGELLTLKASSSDSASHLVYVENRPSEKGRAALISTPILTSKNPAANDLTKGLYNARSAVHEYGGGAITGSDANGSVIFASYKPNDFGVYRVKDVHNTSEPERITSQNPPLRYANFAAHPLKPHLIAAIQEDHTIDEPSKVITTLVLINAEEKTITTLHSGYDFYSNPAWSANGDFLAWVSWQHPSMPFWATEVWAARFVDEPSASPHLVGPQSLAGAKGEEVVHHPIWLPKSQSSAADTLILTSDRTGFSNPYKVAVKSKHDGITIKPLEAVLRVPLEADFHAPPWLLGNSSIIALTDDLLVCTLIRGSSESIALLTPSTGHLVELESAYVNYAQLRKVSSTSIAAIVGTPHVVPSVVIIDLSAAIAGKTRKIDQGKDVRLIQQSSDLVSSGQIPEEYLSTPQDIEFPTTLPDGTETTAHAIFFPPTNPKSSAPKGSSPPCILKIHGGPTGSASKHMALPVNFWTSRGYAICFVNYGGSTGYGREYMMRLMNNWGLVDVLDCAAAVKYLGSPRDAIAGRVSDAEANKWTQTAQEQRKNLQERYHSNGSVEVILKGHKVTWSGFDLAALPALSGAGALLSHSAAHLLPAFLTPIWALPALGAAGYLASKLFRAVLGESVWASPNFGLQLQTTRGFKVPFTNKTIVTSKSTQHIPRDRLLELGLYSAVKGWTISDYLAVGIRSHPLGPKNEKDVIESSVTRQQKVLFPNLAPRLPIVQRIYKALYPSLFPSSSNPLENAAKVPKLKQLPSRDAGSKPLPPLADPKKMIISGGSAGGFTVLACLSVHPTLFSAGTSFYGVADLKALAAESHKFESQYPFRLLSGTPEQVPEVYHDRSPLHHADKITAPLLVLQGSEDKVVPPNQARMMVDKIKSTPGGEGRVKYIEFEGEGHGFRQSQNVVTALVEEERWYRTRLGLDQ